MSEQEQFTNELNKLQNNAQTMRQDAKDLEQSARDSYAPPAPPKDKAKELRKMKAIMLGALLAAFGLFIVSIYFQIPWLKAMSEAAMVGALADWFAVVALFSKPLGIPFHTAIIPRNKDKIATNLGIFIKEEFLSKESLSKSVFIKEKVEIKSLIEDFINNLISISAIFQHFCALSDECDKILIL